MSCCVVRLSGRVRIDDSAESGSTSAGARKKGGFQGLCMMLSPGIEAHSSEIEEETKIEQERRYSLMRASRSILLVMESDRGEIDVHREFQ